MPEERRGKGEPVRVVPGDRSLGDASTKAETPTSEAQPEGPGKGPRPRKVDTLARSGTRRTPKSREEACYPVVVGEGTPRATPNQRDVPRDPDTVARVRRTTGWCRP